MEEVSDALSVPLGLDPSRARCSVLLPTAGSGSGTMETRVSAAGWKGRGRKPSRRWAFAARPRCDGRRVRWAPELRVSLRVRHRMAASEPAASSQLLERSHGDAVSLFPREDAHHQGTDPGTGRGLLQEQGTRLSTPELSYGACR